jgi:hypothetical protein
MWLFGCKCMSVELPIIVAIEKRASLRRCCLVTAVVYLIILQSLPSNGSTRHNMF